MPDYGRFCPVSLGSEVLADRWTPLIVRELVLGNTRFNDIARGLPGISRSLLVQRLRHLERKGVVELWPSPTGRGNEYHLTPAGKDLEAVVVAARPLGRRVAVRRRSTRTRSSPCTLTWWMHRRIDEEQLPPGPGGRSSSTTPPPSASAVWMVLDRGEASVCVQHPGFDPDVVVTTHDAGAGRGVPGLRHVEPTPSPTDAIRVDGPPRLVRALPRWFLWSPFADVTQAKLQQHVEEPAVTA